MTLFEVATTICRCDAAMIKAGLGERTREAVLSELSLAMIKDGLREPPLLTIRDGELPFPFPARQAG